MIRAIATVIWLYAAAMILRFSFTDWEPSADTVRWAAITALMLAMGTLADREKENHG